MPSGSGNGPRTTGKSLRDEGGSLLASGVRAFSLIEIMVTVGLLSFIILGLVAMFVQTQRAFKGSMTQGDLLESGRAVSDMLGRELAEMKAAQAPFTTNFLAEVAWTPTLQALPGSVTPVMQRTNVLQTLFFLTQLNQDWIGIGYEVVPEAGSPGIGALCRFIESAPNSAVSYLCRDFARAVANGWVTNRIADGIVHLRVKALAPNGFPIIHQDLYPNAFYCTNRLLLRYSSVTNAYTSWYGGYREPVNYYFVSNALPAYVELELGVLESQMLQQYKSIPTPNAKLAFLSNHVAQVHLFRQRIPIRNVDPSAYK